MPHGLDISEWKNDKIDWDKLRSKAKSPYMISCINLAEETEQLSKLLTDAVVKAQRMYNKVVDDCLKQYRSSCKSDEEFSQRMRAEYNKDGFTQYYFDGIPTFYASLKTIDNKIVVDFKLGSYEERIED